MQMQMQMQRNRRRLGSLAMGTALLLALSACGSDQGVEGSEATQDPAAAGGTETPGDGETTEAAAGDGLSGGDRSVKVGHPSTMSIYDVHSVINSDRLNSQGWNVEDVEFARTGLNPQALAQNTTQVAIIIGVEPLRTFQAGGDNPKIKYVMDNNGGEFALVARSEYPTCEDFDGLRFGIHGETSSSSVAAVDYIREECGAEPQTLVIPGGENRIVALENGELDATLVQLSDWLELQKVSDEGEYVLVDSGDALDFNGGYWWVNTDWYDANPEVAAAYFGEVLRTCQMVHDDPSILAEAVLEHTETMSEDTVEEGTELYLDPKHVNLCPEDGGDLTMLQQIIDYNVEAGEIDPMNAEDLVHPTLLQEAREYLANNP